MLLESERQMKEMEGMFVPNNGFNYLWISESTHNEFKYEATRIFGMLIDKELGFEKNN
jgi:hypothetical protein